MADRLSKVYGTQMDKVNCPFFYKIGACRYGDSCERIHNKPPISETIMLHHMYENNPIETALISGNVVSNSDADKAMNKFQQFYQNVFKQMSNYGEIQDMIVVDNLGDHIVGNVYVKFSDEDYAENAYKNINGRFLNGKKIESEFSPVTDFLNAKCKQYMDGSCKRGGYCNYMHIKPLSKSFKKQLFAQMYLEHPQYREKRPQKQDSDDDRNWRRRGDKKFERRDHREKRERGGDRENDHDRDRERERKHRRSNSDSKSKSRSRDKKRKDKKKRKQSSSSQRNSQQRRNMIAKWNADNY